MTTCLWILFIKSPICPTRHLGSPTALADRRTKPGFNPALKHIFIFEVKARTHASTQRAKGGMEAHKRCSARYRVRPVCFTRPPSTTVSLSPPPTEWRHLRRPVTARMRSRPCVARRRWDRRTLFQSGFLFPRPRCFKPRAGRYRGGPGFTSSAAHRRRRPLWLSSQPPLPVWRAPRDSVLSSAWDRHETTGRAPVVTVVAGGERVRFRVRF